MQLGSADAALSPLNAQTPQLGDAEASGGGGAPGLADALCSSAKEGAAALSWVGAGATLTWGVSRARLVVQICCGSQECLGLAWRG